MYDPHLDVFLQVAELGSFSRAAEALFISAPAVIKQISLLEDRIGVKLFRRTHQGAALTEAGKSLYGDAKRIIQASSEAVIRARNAMQSGDNTKNSDSYQDFPAGRHYLELSQSEADMVELVCSNFDNVVVICNSSNTMDLSFVDDYPQIKSVVWCPGTGSNGFNSLGHILNGTVNPSGKTADTFIRDFIQAPYWNNFGLNIYDNMGEFRIADSDPYVPGAMPHFVNYVGYKYWETAAAEGFIHYDEMVQYPFGHGLSYTSFTQEMGAISESNGTINFDVTVTNTGSVAGKDVVEVYYNPPYTNGGIEKASANLLAFDKTDMLEPGASRTLTLSFHVEDMASYDMSGAGGYVLKAGDFIISINRDSHNIIDSQSYTVTADIDYTDGRSTDQAAPVNLFDFAKGEIEYLSRADGFANFGYMDATRAICNGGSTCLINRDVTTNNVTDTSNPLTVQRMRQACKDILYTGVNSRGHAPENLSHTLMSWQIILIVVDVLLAAVVIGLEVVIFRAWKKKLAAV